MKQVLLDVLDTPVSPELLPPEDGAIAQKTEDLVGPYELHDFYLYQILRFGYAPEKVYRMAVHAFGENYDKETVLNGSGYFTADFSVSSSNVPVCRTDRKLVPWQFLREVICGCQVTPAAGSGWKNWSTSILQIPHFDGKERGQLMISSTGNAQIKQAAALVKKAKYRRETGLFVVEGPKMFYELPKDRIHTVFVSESFGADRAQEAVGRHK